MNNFIVIVIDSFGIGEMPDVTEVRPQDKGTNTCAHILQYMPNLQLPALEKLGLINALGFLPLPNKMRPNPNAVYGCALLQHDGGDTFMGHQEIMGTRPLPPLKQPFSSVIDQVEHALQQQGYTVERIYQQHLAYLWVNHAVAIGDNLEADLGQVYNISANLNDITFDKVQKIATIVRKHVNVSRVIAFGGELTSNEKIHQAAEVLEEQYIGINAPKSGVYEHNYHVVHLGYGVDDTTQVPEKLHQAGIKTVLIGKVADIVANRHGINYPTLVDSETILNLTLQAVTNEQKTFICTNIQETDLAGHAQDTERYADRLQLTDRYLTQIMAAMSENDCLVVMADHGNDPTIGHSHHTREKVPLLIYQHGLTPQNIGTRLSLSDVGATVCDYFAAAAPQNGHSFLAYLHQQ